MLLLDCYHQINGECEVSLAKTASLTWTDNRTGCSRIDRTARSRCCCWLSENFSKNFSRDISISQVNLLIKSPAVSSEILA